MSKFDAKVECVVKRPFLHYGTKYQSGDIFPLNPNNRLHKTFLTSKRVYLLPEEHYEYICTRGQKEILGTVYKLDEVVDMTSLDEDKRLLSVRRGYVKKVIKSTKNEDEKVSYSAYCKSKGIVYSEIKQLYQDKYNETLPHHMVAIDKDIIQKIEEIIPEKE